MSDEPLPPASALAARLDAVFTPICRAFASSCGDDPGSWLDRREHQPRWVAQPGGGRIASVDIDDVGQLRQLQRTLNVLTPAGTAENAIPSGAYGVRLTEALGFTTQALGDAWERWWAGAYPEFVGEKGEPTIPVDVIVAATFWGASDLRGKDVRTIDAEAIAVPISHTVHDGIATVAQALAHLSIDRVSPFDDDPLGLLRQLVDDEITEQLAIRTGLNVIGPMSVRGLTFPMPPVVIVDGHSELSSDLVDWLHREKRLRLHRLRGRDDVERRADGAAAAGIGCPVAVNQVYGEASAIGDIAQLVLAGAVATHRTLSD